MEEAFSELEQGELTEEGALVAAAQDSADRAVLVLDETLSRPLSAGGRPAALLQVAASERHIAAAVRDLGEAARLSEADILVEYEGAKAVQRRAVATIIAVVTTGLVLALAGGIYLAKAVLGPLRTLREAVRRLGDGVLSHRVALRRGDEFGELGDAFNGIADALPPAGSSHPASSSPSPRPARSSSPLAPAPSTRPAASSGTGRTPRPTARPTTCSSASTCPLGSSPMTP